MYSGKVLKVIFLSNFMNHHWLSFSRAMNEFEDIEFSFVETETVPPERLNMGYRDFSKLLFVKQYNAAIQKEIDEADAVIVGGCDPEIVRDRIENGLLTFRQAERIYKKGIYRRLRPKAYRFVNDRFLQYKNHSNFYVLCSSAYLPYDLSLWKFPVSKCLKWGYFPDTGETEYHEKSNDTIKILWAGRVIPYKQPEYAGLLSEELQKAGYQAEITLIGNGSRMKKMQQYKNINFTGSLPYEEVYKHMKMSDIFLFTSNREEGWGAVLNEAMQMGCIPLACADAGATPFLVKDGVNGFVYRNHDKSGFLAKARKIMDDDELRKRVSMNAFETIEQSWSAKKAAERMHQFILNQTINSDDGPLSAADVIKEGSFI